MCENGTGEWEHLINSCTEISENLKRITGGRVVSFIEAADEKADKQAIRIMEAIEKARKGKSRSRDKGRKKGRGK